MLEQAATIQTKCPISGAPIQFQVSANGPEPEMWGIVHFAIPAAKWWDDIGYT